MNHHHRGAFPFINRMKLMPANIEGSSLERIKILRYVHALYQTTSAIEQFRPLPIPMRAQRVPSFTRPFSIAFLNVIGTDAGPTFPNSGNVKRAFL